jgi:hypothetical protein
MSISHWQVGSFASKPLLEASGNGLHISETFAAAPPFYRHYRRSKVPIHIAQIQHERALRPAKRRVCAVSLTYDKIAAISHDLCSLVALDLGSHAHRNHFDLFKIITVERHLRVIWRLHFLIHRVFQLVNCSQSPPPSPGPARFAKTPTTSSPSSPLYTHRIRVEAPPRHL